MEPGTGMIISLVGRPRLREIYQLLLKVIRQVVVAELQSDSMPELLAAALYSQTLLMDDPSAGALAGADWKPATSPIWANPVWRAHLLDWLADQKYTECWPADRAGPGNPAGEFGESYGHPCLPPTAAPKWACLTLHWLLLGLPLLYPPHLPLFSSLPSVHTMCLGEWWLQPSVSSVPKSKWLQLYLPYRYQPDDWWQDMFTRWV